MALETWGTVQVTNIHQLYIIRRNKKQTRYLEFELNSSCQRNDLAKHNFEEAHRKRKKIFNKLSLKVITQANHQNHLKEEKLVLLSKIKSSLK